MAAYIKNPAAYGNKKMPPFAEVIKDENELKLIIEYVRFLGENCRK